MWSESRDTGQPRSRQDVPSRRAGEGHQVGREAGGGTAVQACRRDHGVTGRGAPRVRGGPDSPTRSTSSPLGSPAKPPAVVMSLQGESEVGAVDVLVSFPQPVPCPPRPKSSAKREALRIRADGADHQAVPRRRELEMSDQPLRRNHAVGVGAGQPDPGRVEIRPAVRRTCSMPARRTSPTTPRSDLQHLDPRMPAATSADVSVHESRTSVACTSSPGHRCLGTGRGGGQRLEVQVERLRLVARRHDDLHPINGTRTHRTGGHATGSGHPESCACTRISTSRSR